MCDHVTDHVRLFLKIQRVIFKLIEAGAMDVVKASREGGGVGRKSGGIRGKGKRKHKLITTVRKSTRKCEKTIEVS